MAKKVYAVRVGHKPGIYGSWAECQKFTKGFSGAEFKSFKTMEEAEIYMDGGAKPVEALDDPYTVKAYVDGSYDHTALKYAGGAVLLHNNEEVYISEAGDDAKLVGMRNVAGELLGAMRAMEWFDNHREENGAKRLVIYHDYEGIAKWAQGTWQAKKEGTQAYVKVFNAYREKFVIEFIKVLAHSGDKYNEVADQLAKKALGLAD